MRAYLKDFIQEVTNLKTDDKEKEVLHTMLELFSDSRVGCEVLADIANAIMEKECADESN